MTNKWYQSCSIFSIITIVVGLISLFFGQKQDTHLHLLMRFLFCVAAIYTIGSSAKIIKIKSLQIFADFLLAIFFVFGFTWLTKFIEPLDPHAFRDVFWNFTPIYFIIGFSIWLKNVLRARRMKLPNPALNSDASATN